MKLQNTVLTKTACTRHVKLKAQSNHPDENYGLLSCTAGRTLKAGECSLEMQKFPYIEPSLWKFAAFCS